MERVSIGSIKGGSKEGRKSSTETAGVRCGFFTYGMGLGRRCGLAGKETR